MNFLGKSFLHITSSVGQVHIMKVLLQYTPNLDAVSAELGLQTQPLTQNNHLKLNKLCFS